MARVKDIAEMLGVSPSAVSIALNNKPGISEETRRRILEAANELGYRKHTAADPKTQVLQLMFYVEESSMVDPGTNPVFSKVVEGVTSRAAELGYILQITYIRETEMQEGKTLESYLVPNCGGVMVLASDMDASMGEKLLELPVPVLSIDNAFPASRINSVSIDNEYGIISIMNSLVEKGHRDFCFVTSNKIMENMNARRLIFQSYLHMHPEIHCSMENPVLMLDHSSAMGAIDLLSMEIAHLSSMPTAFVCVNDWMASAVLRVLLSMGYKVPEDISVTGFDNIPLSEMYSPNITTVDIAKAEIGRLSVSRLVELIEGDVSIAKIKVLPDMIERESTGRSWK